MRQGIGPMAWVALACVLAQGAAAQEAAPAAAAVSINDELGALEQAGGVTIITSDKLTFDYNKRYALFEGNVVVTDPKMKLNGRVLTVRFDQKNEVESIIAKGDVRIQMQDKHSESALATYDVALGKITLEGNPRVMRGRDILEGDRIVFWRNENKMVCEPRARLIIFPDEGSNAARGQLLGE